MMAMFDLVSFVWGVFLTSSLFLIVYVLIPWCMQATREWYRDFLSYSGKFKAGDHVYLSNFGREQHKDSDRDPHNMIGVVTYVRNGDGRCIRVKWNKLSESYKSSDLMMRI